MAENKLDQDLQASEAGQSIVAGRVADLPAGAGDYMSYSDYWAAVGGYYTTSVDGTISYGAGPGASGQSAQHQLVGGTTPVGGHKGSAAEHKAAHTHASQAAALAASTAYNTYNMYSVAGDHPQQGAPTHHDASVAYMGYEGWYGADPGANGRADMSCAVHAAHQQHAAYWTHAGYYYVGGPSSAVGGVIGGTNKADAEQVKQEVVSLAEC